MVVKLRQPYLRHALVLPNAGTHIEPINIRQPIMDFYLRLYATNGATSNISNSLIDVLNTVSILDGSDVLYSLDAEEIMALAYYHYKESISMGIDERADQVQSTVFKIPLGLGRAHPDVAFDPTRFANPQLVIDWNLANIRAVGADAFVSDSLRLEIIADVLDETPKPPDGYLMSKQLYEFTTVAAPGETRVELPVDYPYRTIFVRPFYANHCPKVMITKAKHSINEDHYIPFDIYTIDWEQWLKEWYGLWHQGYWYRIAASAAETRNPYLRSNLSASLEASVAASDPLLTSLANCELNITNGLAAATAFHAKCDGSLPFETYAWPYGDPDEPEEWLPFAYTDKSRLVLTNGTAGGLCQVFITQYRKY